MILFDYGQTLVDEGRFDGTAGTEAILQYAVSNPHKLDAAAVQAKADELNREIGRFDPERRHLVPVEVTNEPFQRLLYESLDIELSLNHEECEDIFWRAATPYAKPCNKIRELLNHLNMLGIRTGVISNISFSGRALKNRIDELLPDNHFEFIIASSDYVFRKPNRRLFELALTKAKLTPDKVWYCGDQPLCDITGAHSVGMTGVFYRGAIKQDSPQYNNTDADIVIDSWSELYNII